MVTNNREGVVVIGGGPAGIAAAWAVAQAGVEVLLIERYGFLGGMATAGQVGTISGHYLSPSKPAVAGFLKLLVEKMAELGGCITWKEAFKEGGISFDVESFKYAADLLLLESGTKLLLHSFLSGIQVEDGRVKSIEVVNKSGRQQIAAEVFVDATGDADLTYLASFPCRKGRPEDGRMQAMGNVFRMAGIDEARVTEKIEKEAAAKLNELRNRGELKIYSTGLGGKGSTIREGERTFNMTHFAGDATRVKDLTAGEIELRKEVHKIVKFLRENVPGFERAYLSAMPSNIGIRETRQIEGKYTLTTDDILSGRKSNDSIARGTYWIDIHCPLGRTADGVNICSQECTTQKPCPMLNEYRSSLPQKHHLYPPEGTWFSIPLGCLIPKKAKNLLVAGRCISATHQAMSAIRVISTCMATGQAAGVAAALAVKNMVLVLEVPVKEIQGVLTIQHGLF